MSLTWRAWAFQERLLSPRVLNITSLDWVLECDAVTVYEGGPDSHESRLDLANKRLVYDTRQTWSRVNAYQSWIRIVEEYSSKQLSYETDRLPALSGLAAIMEHRTGDEYSAGLWKGDLVYGLLWSCTDNFPRTPPMYLAPSWSWASILNEVVFHSAPRHFYNLEVINVQKQLSTSNPFGEISSASLTVPASLKFFQCHALRPHLWLTRTHTLEYTTPTSEARVVMFIMFDHSWYPRLGEDDVWFLACTSDQSIGNADFHSHHKNFEHRSAYRSTDTSPTQFWPHHAHGLVLEHSCDETAMYKRIGIFQIERVSGTQKDWHHLGFISTTVTII